MEDQKDRCPTNQRYRIRIKQVLAQYNLASIFYSCSLEIAYNGILTIHS